MMPRNPWEFPDPLGLDRCEHGIAPDESCDDCLLDVAAERMAAGEDVTPEIGGAVLLRDWERRR